MLSNEEKLIRAMSGIVDIQTSLTGGGPRRSLGERVLSDRGVQKFIENRSDLATIELETKASIIGDHTQNHPLSHTAQPAVNAGAERRLVLRDLLRSGRTDQGGVEVPREATLTNNAGPQVGGSPEQYQDVTKPESGITFSVVFQPLISMAHWIPVSKQILNDSVVLDSFLNQRLLYALAVATDSAILNGSGANGELDGLLTNATAWAPSTSPVYSQEMDVLRDVIRQIETADFQPSGVVLHPADWHSIEIRKAASSGNDAYNAGAPTARGAPQLFGLPVISTPAISAGTALIADFQRCCMLFDQGPAVIEISRQHGDGVTKGTVVLRAEERLAVVTTNSSAMVSVSI